MGCVYSKPTSALPGTVHTVSSVRPHVDATSATKPCATTSVLPTIRLDSFSTSPAAPVTFTNEYSSLSLTATAALAGMVHGVVVHTARDAPASSTDACSAGKPFGIDPETNGNAT